MIFIWEKLLIEVTLNKTKDTKSNLLKSYIIHYKALRVILNDKEFIHQNEEVEQL